jgi:release factor glutamine methyltransferase
MSTRPSCWLNLEVSETTTLRQLLAWGRAGLVHTDSEAAISAEWLLLAALGGVDRGYLWQHGEAMASPAVVTEYRAAILRRQQGEPVAYITGERGFWRLQLQVDPATLIPRSESEHLVEQALKLLPTTAQRVADLGTGSGAIALALALERPAWQIVGSDCSAAALVIAEANRQRYQLANVSWHHGDWLHDYNGAPFHLIVSNPPYIAASDPHLQQGDLPFEPRGALTDGSSDGLASIRAIIALAPRHLCHGGWLLLEHGYDQAEAVADLLQQGGFSQLAAWQDYAGQWRIAAGSWLFP